VESSLNVLFIHGNNTSIEDFENSSSQAVRYYQLSELIY